MDDCSDNDNSLGTGAGEQLHDGRFYSHPAGHCHYYFDIRSHPGTEVTLERRNRTILKCESSILLTH